MPFAGACFCYASLAEGYVFNEFPAAVFEDAIFEGVKLAFAVSLCGPAEGVFCFLPAFGDPPVAVVRHTWHDTTEYSVDFS